MLFHSVAAPRPGVDIQQLIARPAMQIDRPRMVRAFAHVTAHHPILRTSFHFRGLDRPEQRVHDVADIPVETLNLSHLPAPEREAEIDRFLLADRLKGFEVDRAPCQRLTFIEVADDRSILVWTFHHLLLDGRSFFTVIDDVLTTHAALREGGEPPVLSPHPDFGDYLAWVASRDLKDDERFWREALGGAPLPTPLTAERSAREPLPPGASPSGRLLGRVDESTSGALYAAAKDAGVTPNTLVQLAWSILLARYGGTSDVVFGATRAGRHGTVAGANDMVGMTINTLPVRARVPPGGSIREAADALRSTWVEMRPHEQTPLTAIGEWVGAGRGGPLFESILVVEAYDWKNDLARRGHAAFTEDLHIAEWTNYPLMLMVDLGPEIVLHLEWDRTRFDEAVMKRMLRHVETLLRGLAKGVSDAPISDLPMLAEEEVTALLERTHPGPRVEWDEPETLSGLVAAQVARTPKATAVIADDATLTFEQLADEARHVAAALGDRGVRSGDVVGVLAGRSALALTTMLAVLDVGAAFVPLDPGYPDARLSAIIEDARPAAVACAERLLERGRALVEEADAKAEPLCVRLGSEGGHVAGAAPGESATGDSIAYVLFTSGSTGRPKGAMNTHAAIRNRLLWMRDEYDVGPRDRVLQKTPLGFDVSVWELFLPLVCGATEVVAPEGAHREPRRLAELIDDEAVTICHFVPSMLAAFLEGAPAGCGKSLRDVIASGEALPPDVARRFLEAHPAARLHNLYGPTEAAVDVTAHPVTKVDGPSVSIGRPIANTTLRILDDVMRLVPVGVPGELFIGGVQVARGYVGRPELTRERFVADPFGPEGSTLYRTGDLGRFAEDGSVEFLGRRDAQVKVRGVRIELGEIEAVLRGAPGIKDAAAVVVDEGAGPRLLAVVVMTEGFDEAAVRRHAESHLPDAMVPAALLQADRLPLSPNGKLDRARVRALARRLEGELPRDAAAARTPVEAVLADIFARALGRATVGVEDDFFSLGGHSLAALRIVDLAGRAGLVVETEALLANPTVRSLAARVRTRAAGGDAFSCLVPLRTRGDRPALFLIHTTPGDIFGYTSLVEALGSDQPVYGIQSRGLGPDAQADTSIEAMADRYLALAREVAGDRPLHLAGWCYGGVVAFEMARRLRARGLPDPASLQLIDAPAPRPGVGVPLWYADRIASLVRSGPSGIRAWVREKVALRRAGENTGSIAEALAHEIARGPLANRGRVSVANLRALDQYEPKFHPGAIFLVRAEFPRRGTIPDELLGWRRLARRVRVEEIATATHEDILRPPHAAVVAHALRREMDRAR